MVGLYPFEKLDKLLGTTVLVERPGDVEDNRLRLPVGTLGRIEGNYVLIRDAKPDYVIKNTDKVYCTKPRLKISMQLVQEGHMEGDQPHTPVYYAKFEPPLRNGNGVIESVYTTSFIGFVKDLKKAAEDRELTLEFEKFDDRRKNFISNTLNRC